MTNSTIAYILLTFFLITTLPAIRGREVNTPTTTKGLRQMGSRASIDGFPIRDSYSSLLKASAYGLIGSGLIFAFPFILSSKTTPPIHSFASITKRKHLASAGIVMFSLGIVLHLVYLLRR